LPRVQKSEFLITCILAAIIVAVFGAICLRVASAGGPEWLEGQEFEVFLKLAGLTMAAAIAEISWRAIRVTRAEERS
jgi:hypothetical protein